MERHGFILIADISGYTVFLRESELEHAQGTLTELLELLVDHTRPPLVISRLEGDAVLSYGLEDKIVEGQTFIETIESTYVAFRRAIELMVLNNTCRCNACANVSSLDLKFFLHYGAFAIQRIDDHDEMMGTDVNLIHRLMKNSVVSATGIRAYLLCTDAAMEALGLEDATGNKVRHVEPIEDLWEVEVWIEDMHPVFEARRDAEVIAFAPEEILMTLEVEIAAPLEVVWDHMNQSDIRNSMFGSDRFEVENRRNGRIGEGTVYQCFHGKQVMSQVVLDWQPLRRVLLLQHIPLPGRDSHVLIETTIEPVEGGTRLAQVLARPSGSFLQRAAIRTMMRLRDRKSREELEDFGRRVEEDWTAREVPEPGGMSPEAIGAAAAASLREH